MGVIVNYFNSQSSYGGDYLYYSTIKIYRDIVNYINSQLSIMGKRYLVMFTTECFV